MNIDICLNLKDGRFLSESLCFIGITLQNNKQNLVHFKSKTTSPYILFQEGFITSPEIFNQVRRTENIIVYKNKIPIIEKITNSGTIKKIKLDQYVWNLYNEEERISLKDLICSWKEDQKIYLKNTETVPSCENRKSVAGVASGTALASIAYNSNAEKILFFDYNEKSLKFQKDLIESKNRKEVYYCYKNYLTMGRPIHVNTRDIDKLNFKKIDNLYDNLKEREVSFKKINFSNKSDIDQLFVFLPNGSHLWISNIIHYATNLFTFDPMIYNYIQSLAKTKNISISPYTQVIYESQTNL